MCTTNLVKTRLPSSFKMYTISVMFYILDRIIDQLCVYQTFKDIHVFYYREKPSAISFYAGTLNKVATTEYKASDHRKSMAKMRIERDRRGPLFSV